MGFQEELFYSLKTKEEAEVSHNNELLQEMTLLAESIYDDIKNKLISLANNGEYVENGNSKELSCILPLPKEYNQWFTITDKSIHIPATPSLLERQFREMTGKTVRQKRQIIKKYQGVDLSGGGKPAQYFPCVYFDLCENRKRQFEYLKSALDSFSTTDSIYTEFCIYDEYKKISYPLYKDIKNISVYKSDYCLALKCDYSVKEIKNAANKVSVSMKSVFSEIPENDFFLKEIISAFTKAGFNSLTANRNDDNTSFTVNGYYKGIEHSFYCHCHTESISNTGIQNDICFIVNYVLSIPNNDIVVLIGNIDSDLSDKNYYATKISTNNSTIFISTHKNGIKYSIKFNSPFFLSNQDNICDNTDERSESSEEINIDCMDGFEFERFCADIISKNGYEKVMVTPGTADQGIDVIAYKDGVKYGIQCKCYSDAVSNKAVQEAFAGKTFYKCHIGIVLSNQYYTRSAKELAEVSGIVLWDREVLLKMIKNAGVSFR